LYNWHVSTLKPHLAKYRGVEATLQNVSAPRNYTSVPNASHSQIQKMTLRSIYKTFGSLSSSESICLPLFSLWRLIGEKACYLAIIANELHPE